MPNFFAKNLRMLRQKKRLSQQELGFSVSLTQKNIASYETGHAHPGYDKLIAIARFFELTIDQLLTEEIK